MRRWLLMLGGLGIWAIHFMGVYGIASIADVAAEADAPASRVAVAVFTVGCLAADVVLLWWAARAYRTAGPETGRWMASTGAMAAVFSLVAVAWQGLPALVGH